LDSLGEEKMSRGTVHVVERIEKLFQIVDKSYKLTSYQYKV